MEVHQILPTLSYGDAVSNDAINIRKVLVKNGIKSEIYAKFIHPDVSQYAKPLKYYKKDSRNIVLYHFSLAGDDVTEFIKNLPEKKGLIYHNITPPRFFDNYDPTLSELCRNGLLELKTIAPYILIGIGDSEYNRIDLENSGFTKTGVLPILINFDNFDQKRLCNNQLRNDTINILFVGRIAPNKKFEDLIKIFYYFNKSINQKSHLILVGDKQVPQYYADLQKLVLKLNLTDDVFFVGSVKDDELSSYYKNADIFLCMSEHEGFCVPLLEAMYHDIPIIAYNATAVPYTLGNSGVLINKKDYIQIAELMNIIIGDKKLRERIVTKQKERLSDFAIEKSAEKLLGLIHDLSTL